MLYFPSDATGAADDDDDEDEDDEGDYLDRFFVSSTAVYLFQMI